MGSAGSLATALEPRVKGVTVRRLALSVCGLAAALGCLWLAVLLSGPHAPWSESSEPLALALTDAIGVTAMQSAFVTGAAALLLLVLPRSWGSAGFAEAARAFAGRLARIGAVLLGLGITTILAYVSIRGALAPRSVEWSDVAFGAVVSVLTLGALVLNGHFERNGRWSSADLAPRSP